MASKSKRLDLNTGPSHHAALQGVAIPEVAFRMGFEREKTKGRWVQLGETPSEQVPSKPSLSLTPFMW